MRVGFSVEDATHEGVVHGLRDRWCKGAELVGGRYRGRSGKRRRAELRQDFEQLRRRGCDCVVILRDADTRSWHQAVRDERGKLPDQPDVPVVIGAPTRNIECWLSADPVHFASTVGGDETQIRNARKDDPKGLVQAALKQKADADDTSVAEAIEGYTRDAPLAQWLEMNCFNAFYEECQQLAADMGCDPLPNERDAKARDSSP
jgi:hypothetical protein